ncbi:NACHT domain-containing protein [Streptomyces sp. CA-249302]|uniref:NACHT domain-containing protein n=1 Tax=Streptomyces sp. CA-249302 TaxID=3240058 RepID=UPI003D8A351D
MGGLGGRRHRRKWQFISFVSVAGIAASAGFVVQPIAQGRPSAVDAASLLGFLVSVISLVLAVVTLRKPLEGNDADLACGWAKTLARHVEASESQVRRQLLGADTQRINLAYVLHPAIGRGASAPPAGRTFTDDASALPNVLHYYRSTRPQRLVITGAAGAGKTVLALELMLALIDDRAVDEPVPIRIPLAQWDTSLPLPELLAQHLVQVYDWPPDLATGLVDQGLILPVLDGLDEMDSVLDDGRPDPDAPRALAVLDALNAYQDGRDAGPLVLTCRTDHYNALAPSLQLIDAARIAIAPVNAARAVTYLGNRALDTSRWQPLLDHLQAHPTGTFAATLSTPWRLCLTATVYHRTGSPVELLSHATAHDLDQHLLARYIPSAAAITPNPHRYPPDQIHHWLHHLARHLSSAIAAPATDLTLHRLWPLAGPNRVRSTDVRLSSVAVLLPLPLAWIANDPRHPALVGAAFAAVAGVFALRSAEPRRFPTRKNARGSTLAALLEGSLAGLVIGLVCGLVVGRTAGVTAGLAAGLAAGITAGFAVSFEQFSKEPAPVASPRAIIRNDILHGLVIGLAAGSGYGLMIGIAVGYTAGRGDGVIAGVVLGLSAGLAAALGVGLASARRYTVFLLCSRSWLPFRLARFLDWAVNAGLLRYSGPAYQFRHRELQQWLNHHPHP